MSSDLESRLRVALQDDAARVRLLNPDRPADPDARSLPAAQPATRSPRRLVATAAAIALLAAGGAVLFEKTSDRRVEVTTSPEPADPTTTTTTTEATTTTFEAVGPPILARADDVEIAGFGQLDGSTLNIEAVEENGAVAGEFRVDNVVVTIQCANTWRLTGAPLILGGEVTDNVDGLATLDGATVAVGDLLALVIRKSYAVAGGQRVTLYQPSLWHGEQATAGSCKELINSVPPNLDGGFFDDVKDGHHIQTR